MSAELRLTVLSDNRSSDPACFPTEHGLSILLDTVEHRILLDTGASDLFLRNARKLGINLADVDYAFLSHGHSDHAGGLGAFLEVNSRAKVIVSSKALGKGFFSTKGGLHSITSSWPLDAMEGRTIYIDKSLDLGGGIRIIADIPQAHPIPKGNRNLLIVEGRSEIRLDTFRHEIAFYADGVLFTGCAHNGLENILAASPRPVKIVIGGFHLLDSKEGNPYESSDELEALGQRLLDKYPDTVFYTGHCTGDAAYRTLKGVMGDKLNSFSGGMQISL